MTNTMKTAKLVRLAVDNRVCVGMCTQNGDLVGILHHSDQKDPEVDLFAHRIGADICAINPVTSRGREFLRSQS